MLNRISHNMDVFEANFKTAKKAYLLNSSMEASACAAAFIGENRPVELEDMKYAKKIVKSNTGILSTLGRGNASQVVAATVAMSPEKERAMDAIKRIHAGLDKKFLNSDYLVLAATMIYKNVKLPDYERMIDRTREIYKLQRAEHPLLTGREDLVNCVLMALSEYEPTQISRRSEDDFDALRKYFVLKNRIQYLANVSSVFDGEPEYKAEQISKTYQALKSEGIRFSTDAFSVIAAIAMLVKEEDRAVVIKAIAETGRRLRSLRGMGALGAGKRIRNLIACAIVTDAYAHSSNLKVKDAAISAIISAIIAAEVAAIAAASAAAASSAAASS